jgi:hypothetical protein
MSRREKNMPPSPEVERELDALDAALRGDPVDPGWADTAELALLLRADRPQASAAFARELDERAANGFPRAASRPKRRRWSPSPALGLAACALLAVVVVVATGSPSKHSETAERAVARPAATAAAGAQGAQPRAVQSYSSTSAPPPSGGTVTTRRVEHTVSLTLGVPRGRVEDASHQVFDITTRLFRGYVLSSSVTAGDGATFQLKIPTVNLADAEARLAQLGRVRAQNDATQDITGSFVSADRRLADVRAERGALLRALARATTRNETAAVRARLRIAEQEIAQAQRDLRALGRRADLTSLSLTIVPDAHATPGKGDGFTPGGALRIAGRILSVALSVLLVVFAVALPLALLGWLGWTSTRLARRRRREQALETA